MNPHALILYDGARIETGDNLLSAGTVTRSRTGEAQTANISLYDPYLELANTLRLPTKKNKVEVEVWLGEDARDITKIFHGFAVGWTPNGAPPNLEIMAIDRTRGMRRAERAKNWSNFTPAALITQICEANGFQVDLSRAALDEKAFGSMIQSGETDWQLLERVCALWGHEIFERDGVIIIEPGHAEQATPRIVRYGDNLLSWSFEIDEKTPSRAANIELLGGEEAIEGEDTEARARDIRLEGTGLAVTNLDFPSYTDQAIERAAKAQAKARKVFTGSVSVSEVWPDLDQQSQIVLQGLGPRFSTVWNVDRVVHHLTMRKVDLSIYNGGAP